MKVVTHRITSTSPLTELAESVTQDIQKYLVVSLIATHGLGTIQITVNSGIKLVHHV